MSFAFTLDRPRWFEGGRYQCFISVKSEKELKEQPQLPLLNNVELCRES